MHRGFSAFSCYQKDEYSEKEEHDTINNIQSKSILTTVDAHKDNSQVSEEESTQEHKRLSHIMCTKSNSIYSNKLEHPMSDHFKVKDTPQYYFFPLQLSLSNYEEEKSSVIDGSSPEFLKNNMKDESILIETDSIFQRSNSSFWTSEMADVLSLRHANPIHESCESYDCLEQDFENIRVADHNS